LIHDKIACLIAELHSILSNGQPIREHDLLNQCDHLDVFDDVAAESDLALFQKHFILKHALYSLKRDLRDAKLGDLSIDAINIHLQPWSQNSEEQAILGYQDSAKLEEYYLELANLYEETEDSVDEMLRAFWSMYIQRVPVTEAQRSEALDTLGLSWPCDIESVKDAYRRKAQALHPDKGGDMAAFVKLRESYDLLREQMQGA